MPVPPTEPGTIKAILETLFKPVTLILNPIAERIGHSLKRKPKLHIYVRPRTTVWCYAWEDQKPMMQAQFSADITHDGEEDVFILDGYIEGTKPQVPFRERIYLPPRETLKGVNIAVFVAPVVGEGGKDF